jgi:hypothetical protein
MRSGQLRTTRRLVAVVSVSWCIGAAAAVAPEAFRTSSQETQRPTSNLVGIVDKLSGRWALSADQRQLRVRSPIYSTDSIFTRDSTAASITVHLVTTGKPWSLACSQEKPCRGSYKPASSSVSGLWAFVTLFGLSEEVLNRILPAARGVSSGGPNHAVVNRSSSGIDLTPALEQVAPGSYTVTLRRITDTGDEAPGLDASVRVGGGGKADVTLLDAGLYRLTVVDHTAEPVGLPAIVLALDNGDAETRAIWKEAVAETRAWTTASPGTIDSARVRVLFALNERRKRG